jgi:8-oxo-dGTP diphosphatase
VNRPQAATTRTTWWATARLLVGRGIALAWGFIPSDALRAAIVFAISPHFQVSVQGVVVDGRSRVLLFRHVYDFQHPWGLPSGRMEANEQPEQTIVREIAEETGFEATVDQLVAVRRDGRYPVVRISYRCRLVGGVFRPSVEVTEARFFALDALPPGMRPQQRMLIYETLRPSTPDMGSSEAPAIRHDAHGE